MRINARRSMRVDALDQQARLCAQCITRVSISRQCCGCSIAVRRQATLPHCGVVAFCCRVQEKITESGKHFGRFDRSTVLTVLTDSRFEPPYTASRVTAMQHLRLPPETHQKYCRLTSICTFTHHSSHLQLYGHESLPCLMQP